MYHICGTSFLWLYIVMYYIVGTYMQAGEYAECTIYLVHRGATGIYILYYNIGTRPALLLVL